jgi:uncharacterized protein
MTLLKRHPLIAFFVLAYSLSWWPWILYALHLVPTSVFAPGRSVAALVVIALSGGKTGMRAFFRRLLVWHTELKWYLVAWAFLWSSRLRRWQAPLPSWEP